MNKKNKITKYIYIGLFATLYISVALVSGIHAVAFFSLANVPALGVMLAVTFEIGQAAVLFSLLTNPLQRKKVMTWVQLSIFTLIQVLGNVYSSYKYIVTHSIENLRFFREPVFMWTDLPDQTCNVIITYLVGGVLPISALMLTEMLTSYLYGDKPTIEEKSETKKIETKEESNDDQEKDEPEVVEEAKQDPDNKEDDAVSETNNRSDSAGSEEVQQDVKGTDEDDIKKIEEDKEVQENKKSHFLNI